MKKSKAKIGKKPAAKAAKPAKKTPGRKPGKVAAKKLPAKRAAKVAPAKAAAKAPAKPAPVAAKPAAAPAKPVPAPAPAKPAAVAAKPAPAPAAAKPAPAVKKTIVVKAAKNPPVKPPVPVMPKRGRGRPPKNPRIVPPAQPAAAAASAKPALVLSPALVKHAAPAPAKKQEVKERGDRRKKGVALVKGRRKADKLLVVFDSVPNHLVLAFREGGVEDHRFKAKDDAKKCIQGLMAEGLAPQRIAYYSRQDYGLDVNVRL